MLRHFIILALLVLVTYPANAVIVDGTSLQFNTNTAVTVLQSHEETVQIDTEKHADHSTEHHSTDTAMLFFIIMAVFIGALTRHFLKKIPIPFTALLLILGLVLGVIMRYGGFEMWGGLNVSFIKNSLYSAAHIDPHLLLYIFLPILIFEAAFAMDLHTFKRSAGNSIILAVPGIVLALCLSALMVFGIDYLGLGLPGWANWSLALMFGAVISATDPVAVVALLKELGASKKLGTLIEGESLLNDGTAIVIFMVFLTAISGQASEMNGFLQFVIVSFGGIAVGVVIGWIVLKWLKNVFNDAMVEISVVVAAAYLTFYLAEHFFKVSGVLALVTLGIAIGGVGRSSISPKVEHFMHNFWELAGFIANCIIFLIVGIIISSRTQFTANDFLVLGIVYIGIHIIRAIVIFILYPFMKNTGYGLPVKDAIVVWFGALRGAIGLALALIVMSIDSKLMSASMDISISQADAIKDQFLFLTAGVVTLTLLINATTIKALVNYLGLLKVSPAKLLIIHDTNTYLRETDEKKINKIKTDRYLKKANWDHVNSYLPKQTALKKELKNLKINITAETRQRLLEHEKSTYWKQYSDGKLSAKALPFLIEEVNVKLDEGGINPLSDRGDLEVLWKAPKWLNLFEKNKRFKRWYQKQLLKRLSVSQDAAVNFVKAQEACSNLLKSIARNESLPLEKLNRLEQEINSNKMQGQVYIRNLRTNYASLFAAISTEQAIRNVLSYEDKTIDRLLKKGRINLAEAEKMRINLQERWKLLIKTPLPIIADDEDEEPQSNIK